MSLFSCPDCNHYPVSENASACPKCGCVIKKKKQTKKRKSIFKPYIVSEETDEFITYEYKTIYLYAMYCIFALMISGFMTGISALSIVGGVLMVIFFFTVSLKYMTVSRKVKAAMLSGKAEFSGSKFSFKNPLRTTIKKDKLTEIEPASSDKTIPPVI